MKADLHIHSIYSYDAISKPESIFEAAVNHGIDAIAVTDHDSIAGWDHFLKISKNFPVKLVLGQEVKVYREAELVGELLCLFLEKQMRD